MWWCIAALAWRSPLVINGLPFNRENELFDVRVREIGDLVDAFIVVESRYTQYGIRKSLYFRDTGNPKVIHIASNWTHGEVGCKLGWENEGHQRDVIVRDGLGVVYERLAVPPSPLDILIITDADEIPNKGAIQRIRKRPPIDGVIRPIGMHRYLYNFGWRERSGNQQAAYANVDTWQMWKIHGETPTWGPIMRHGGCHCTKCFRPEDFNSRLKDYLCGDGIRWGDYKWPLDTIRTLISRGIWVGNPPNQRSRQSRPEEMPHSARRYPFLVGSTTPTNLDSIRMPYCNDPNPDLRHLQQMWCRR